MDTQSTIDQLNTYAGDDIWQDVIYGIDGFDMEATTEADPSDRSDVIVLTDGTRIEFDQRTGEWE